jgi:hypothetical protein
MNSRDLNEMLLKIMVLANERQQIAIVEYVDNGGNDNDELQKAIQNDLIRIELIKIKDSLLRLIAHTQNKSLTV